MAIAYWTARELHDELATYYRQFRGVNAPENTFTISLWMKIEEVEIRDAERASSRRR